VYTKNSAFEPVNILKADTRNIGGVAKGEMILGLPKDHEVQEEMIAYFREVGLEIEEVTGDVE
jgi:D-methionine transport system ATP-binding protein